MTEDDLLAGLEDALTLGGWRWQHIRRSDRAIVQGYPGLPDLIAMHPERHHGLAIECKSQRGVVTSDQRAWLDLFAAQPGWIAWVVTPELYDPSVVWIVGDRLLPRGA